MSGCPECETRLVHTGLQPGVDKLSLLLDGYGSSGFG
jgi:hypothetical protein